jgi:hypothetical protein
VPKNTKEQGALAPEGWLKNGYETASREKRLRTATRTGSDCKAQESSFIERGESKNEDDCRRKAFR